MNVDRLPRPAGPASLLVLPDQLLRARVLPARHAALIQLGHLLGRFRAADPAQFVAALLFFDAPVVLLPFRLKDRLVAGLLCRLDDLLLVRL